MLTCRRPDENEYQRMLEIFNETVKEGGHSPKILPAKIEGIKRLVHHAEKMNWPVNVVLLNDEVIGWSSLEQIVWGVEICHRTAELAIYVGKKWYGSRAAACLVLKAIHEAPQYGFTAVTCWILGANHSSIALSKACGLQKWGCLPKVAQHGDDQYDLQIWGCHFEDAQWLKNVSKISKRLERICKKESIRKIE